MKLIEKIKSTTFFAKIQSGDIFTKSLLLLLVIGVWAIFIENIVLHNDTQSVYVVNAVDAYVRNTVSVDPGEVDVNVQSWDGHRVGSHEGYTDKYGYDHVAIDVHVDGGYVDAY